MAAAAPGALRAEVAALAALAEACLGPGGRHVAVQAAGGGGGGGGGGLVVTGAAARLLDALDLRPPVLRFLAEQSAQAQLRAFGDGGLTCLWLACRLLLLLLDAPSPSAKLRLGRGLRRAADLCHRHAERVGGGEGGEGGAGGAGGDGPLALPLRWTADAVLALVRSVVSPKGVARLQPPEAGDRVAAVVAQAFLHSLPPPAQAARGPCVCLQPAVGTEPDRSTWTPGLLMDVPVPGRVHDDLLPRDGGGGPLVVALFQVSLDAVDVRQGVGPGRLPVQIRRAGPGAGFDPAEVQLDRLADLLRGLRRAGVGVVASQKLIHPRLQDLAVELGMVPLERLSLRYVQPVARCSGAHLLGSLDPAQVHAQGFGRIAGLESVTLAGRRLVKVRPFPGGPRALPVATVVLGAADALAMRELRAVAAAALTTLGRALAVPAVLPGGGCGERLLARRLRRDASGGGATKSQAAASEHLAALLELYAERVVPKGLEEKAPGREPPRPWAAAGGTYSFAGWRGDERRRGTVAVCSAPGGAGSGARAGPRITVAYVLDLMATRVSAVALAVEAAVTVADIGAVTTEDE